LIKRLFIVSLFLLLSLTITGLIFLITPGFLRSANIPLSITGSAVPTEQNSAVNDLALAITAGLDNDYDKMVAIYDWVTGNLAYDIDKADNIAAYGYGAEYILETGSGICHDYAEITRALLTAVGIEATYEKGDVFLDNGETELHAWNHVLIGDTWYALDTTWGAGYVLEDRSGFVQKPRRLFLTSPKELELLHNDPEYKQMREKEYLLEMSLNKPVIHLPEEERNLFVLSNDYRNRRGLSPLSDEKRLLDLARRHASALAETICAGDDYSLTGLSNELTWQAADMNIRSAAIFAYSKWLFHPGITENYLETAISDHSEPLTEERWKAVTISAARKGDLVAIIFIFVNYH